MTDYVSIHCHVPLVSFIRESNGGWHATGRYMRSDGTTKALLERDSIVQVIDKGEPVTLSSFSFSWSSHVRVRIPCPRCSVVAEAKDLQAMFPIFDKLADNGVRKISLKAIAARLSSST